MKYSYKVDIRSFNTLHYLTMMFDRNISLGYESLGSVNIAPKTEKSILFLTRINAMEGVVKVNQAGLFRSGVIVAHGANLTVLIPTPSSTTEISELANRIAKKFQRIYARGESRKRVKLDKLNKEIEKLNKRVHG